MKIAQRHVTRAMSVAVMANSPTVLVKAAEAPASTASPDPRAAASRTEVYTVAKRVNSAYINFPVPSSSNKF